MNILITGANGFVGRALCSFISSQELDAYALLRRREEDLQVKQQFLVQDFLTHGDWGNILKGMDVVIHTAGLAHVKGHPDRIYYEINTEITKKLALECVRASVKRFVYISSTHVHTASSSTDLLTPESPYHPTTAYGKSKLLAEHALREIEATSNLEVVVIRPPLVYGPFASGNVETLLKAIRKKVPFPFAAIQNKRSMIFVENLVHALLASATHPQAKGQTYFVSDARPLSVREMIQGLAKGMGQKAILFYVPKWLMEIPLSLCGKKEMLEKITGSLQLDISHIQNTIGWHPPISVEEGLERTGRAFCQ